MWQYEYILVHVNIYNFYVCFRFIPKIHTISEFFHCLQCYKYKIHIEEILKKLKRYKKINSTQILIESIFILISHAGRAPFPLTQVHSINKENNYVTPHNHFDMAYEYVQCSHQPNITIQYKFKSGQSYVLYIIIHIQICERVAI